jgi:hypothetical protein
MAQDDMRAGGGSVTKGGGSHIGRFPTAGPIGKTA